MSTSIKNLFVGIFVLSAIATLVSLILFLKPTVGDGKQTVYVRFSDIGSLNLGTRVLFAGRPVGEIVAMEEIKDARDQPTDELGRVYFYQLTLHIDSSVNVYNTDEISIQRSGLMGERSISITPKAPPKEVIPRLITDQPIYANSVDTFQNALLDFTDLSATMEESFQTLTDWMKDYGKEVGHAVRSLGGALSSIQVAIDQMHEHNAFNNAASTIENLKSASHFLDSASHDIATGKGTIGRLITDDHLYLESNALMTKANNLMNDLNHYGLLFHLNKKWQRVRLKKIHALNALSSPSSFQAYFQNEVDDINAAMTRISMLIDRADQNPEKGMILSDPSFKRDFCELMRKADELSDNLKLYNEQFNQTLGESDG